MARAGKRTVVHLFLRGITEHVVLESIDLAHMGVRERIVLQNRLKLGSGHHVEEYGLTFSCDF